MRPSHPLLSRLQSSLPQGNAVEQINALVERDDLEAHLASLDADVLYHLIREAGWDQGADLIPYVSPEQFQNFLDFDAWRRDRFIPARMIPWIATVLTEATDQKFKAVARTIDPEVIALFFKTQLRVWDTEEGRIPDEAPDGTELSPDGLYALLYPEDEAHAALLRALVSRLYELDRVLAWTLIEAVRWELESEMEEHALHWRHSRLETFGFTRREEALAVYHPLDAGRLRSALEEDALPKLVRPVEVRPLDLPEVFAQELEQESLLLRVLGRIDDPTLLGSRMLELGTLLQKVAVADGIEPGELGSARQAIRRAIGYASLGLEYLSRTEEDHAQKILGLLPLQKVFRTGYSLVLNLRRQASRLERRPTLTLLDGLPYSLLRPDDAALMEELMRTRPTYARDAQTFELFEHQEQVDHAALRLGRIALKQLWTFALGRMGPDDLVDLASQEGLANEAIDITFDALFGTWLANLSTRHRGSFDPLGPEELAAWLEILRKRPWEDASILKVFAGLFDHVQATLPPQATGLLVQWVESTLADHLDEFGMLVDAADMHAVATSLLLVKASTLP